MSAALLAASSRCAGVMQRICPAAQAADGAGVGWVDCFLVDPFVWPWPKGDAPSKLPMTRMMKNASFRLFILSLLTCSYSRGLRRRAGDYHPSHHRISHLATGIYSRSNT